jgi:hypothetical protein
MLEDMKDLRPDQPPPTRQSSVRGLGWKIHLKSALIFNPGYDLVLESLDENNKERRTVFSGALFSFLNRGLLIFDETEPSTFLANFDTFGILGQFATAIAFTTDN